MNKTNTQTFTTKTILQNYNPQFKDKILCIGGNTNRAEKMVTEVMVKLMIEHNLTFEEVDEIVFGISVDSYLTSKYYSKLFKYLVLDKSEFLFPKEEQDISALGIFVQSLQEENAEFKAELIKCKKELTELKEILKVKMELENEVEELKRKIKKLKDVIDFFKEDKRECTKSWW